MRHTANDSRNPVSECGKAHPSPSAPFSASSCAAAPSSTFAPKGEDGSTLILIIFSAALALALILGVGAATSLYLERKRLLTLADGAALVASESFDLASVAIDGSGGVARPLLTERGVAQAAGEYLARVSHAGLDDLSLSHSSTEDGRSATVVVTAFWRPPVMSLFLPEGIKIAVHSTARSIFF